ncbi:MAG: cation transporter [Saprospiraceae bacterium]|nr:cation transporter [Saprospiraceae bacterium]
MAHQHHHDTKRIGVAFFLNLFFSIIEIIGGMYTNSMAILSDALHDLGDSISLGTAWYFQKISHRKSDSTYSYGYKRFSILGAIINSIVLIIGSIFILREAIPRLLNPQTTEPAGMILLSILGIIINGYAVYKLKAGHSHNEKVVSLHLLEDVIGWAAVLVGSIVIYFTGWHQIDPILSLVVTIFILYNIYKNIKATMRIVLQGIPEDIDLAAIHTALESIDHVVAHHDLHIWSMDGQRNIMTVHVVITEELNHETAEQIRNQVRQKMKALGIQHSTVEVEHVDMNCVFEDC